MVGWLVAVVLLAPPEVEVRALDGAATSGALSALDAGAAVLDGPAGAVTVEAADLLTISFPTASPPAAAAPSVWVTLIDGSSLVGQGYRVSEGRAKLTLAGGESIELPTSAVAIVRFHDPANALADAWEKILALQPAGDVLVVYRQNNLDFHEGILGDLGEETAAFDLDGERLNVKRAKIAGLVYYHPARQFPRPVCTVVERDGSRWSAAAATLSGESLEIELLSGSKHSRPISGIERIDYSGGKIVYLSDLSPRTVEWTPYFEGDLGAGALAAFYRPRSDRSFSGGELELGDKVWSKGLAVHSRTELVYDLPDEYSRFSATVGIDDRVRPAGHVRLVIEADGKPLFAEEISGRDPPREIALAIGGVKRLSLLVDFGEGADAADRLNLCEAKVVK